MNSRAAAVLAFAAAVAASPAGAQVRIAYIDPLSGAMGATGELAWAILNVDPNSGVYQSLVATVRRLDGTQWSVQLSPAFSVCELVHSLAPLWCGKSPESPDGLIPLRVTDSVPVFVTVELIEPVGPSSMSRLPNAWVVGLSVSCGPQLRKALCAIWRSCT